MIDTKKFEFLKQRVTAGRVPGDTSISDEMLDALKEYLDKTKDHLNVNWEFLDKVDRTKSLRRIKLMLSNEKVSSQH